VAEEFVRSRYEEFDELLENMSPVRFWMAMLTIVVVFGGGLAFLAYLAIADVMQRAR
jgi:hypothetical protein